MPFSLNKCGLITLRYTMAIVVLIEAILFVMPGAARELAHTHMPGFIRLTLGFGEILGGVLLLIPQTAVRGAWFLLAVFVMAILVHLMHGQYNVGNVVIYAAAAFAIATEK
jgi:hypothetical protein